VPASAGMEVKMKNLICKIKRNIKLCKQYGYKYTLNMKFYWLLHRYFNEDNPLWLMIIRNRHKKVCKYLMSKYGHIIDKYKNIKCDENYIQSDSKIWVCWWQGIESAPVLVQKCIESIIENAGSHKVVIITRNNIDDYIRIPNIIMSKVDNGLMSLTHLADFIRLSLLADYGGIWIDATIYMSGELPNDILNYQFYSVKTLSNSEFYISKYKWTTYFLVSSKNNIMFKYLRDIFLEYWENENSIVDFFLLDYTIYLGYEHIHIIKNMIDSVPYNNPQILLMFNKLNEKHTDILYKELTNNTILHKLSWKSEFIENIENSQTLYKYIIG
jgi:hypothetical protein